MKYNAVEFRMLAAGVTGGPYDLENRPASLTEFNLSHALKVAVDEAERLRSELGYAQERRES